jgi:ribosomal protein L16 Arg81 hydroxylase
MLTTWLDDMPRDVFMREHFQRAPLARPATARAAVPLLTWATVAQLIEAHPDTLVVRNAKLRHDAEPRTFAEVVSLFREGYSIVLRRCERHDPSLRALADSVAAELEGDVAIQVYLTPAGFHSFGWHYDCEDVFIAQTGGTKDYLLRRNTVNPEPTLAAMPRDMAYERETTPTIASTLVAGDWLYIPRGWWHAARAIEDSLSISVGVLSPAAAR